MLKTAQRDLLVVSQGKWQSARSLQEEVAKLERLLHKVEAVEFVALSTEIIDINRYRKLKKKKDVVRLLLKKETKGFVFFINCN
jgi:hypothetical protein